MNHRLLGNTKLTVSEIGLGSEVFINISEEEGLKLIDFALEQGINFFDLYNAEPQVRSILGKAMQGRREQFVIQGHLCSAWIDGQYQRTRDMKLVKQAYDDVFTRLGTDYIDIGMIHYVDEQADFDKVFGGEVLAFAKELLASGKIKTIGMSTHNPSIAMQAAKTGVIQVIMLSVNPAYDMLPSEEDINKLFDKNTFANSNLANIDPEREALYRYCETNGIGITVMKPYAGGALLSAEESAFGVAMTPVQCLHYCLTRPAVASVLAGAKSIPELEQAIAYATATEVQKNYADLLSSAPFHTFKDKCMYCGHCAPCTVGIDIATVNKFADLCTVQGMVPETVREHYAVLQAKASDCIGCGICEPNCPFGVKIIEHMQKAKTIFGA